MVRKLEDIYYYTIAVILTVLIAMLLIGNGEERQPREDSMMEALPTAVEPRDGVYTYEFDGGYVEEAGGAIAFMTEHQTVAAYADGFNIYRLNMVHSKFGRTPGKCWNFVEIPEGASSVLLVFTDVYDKHFNDEPHFYAGNPDRMMEQLMRSSVTEAAISLFHIIAGVFMILFWLIISNKAPVSRSLIFLGMLELLLGIWFLGETDIMLLLLKDQRNFATFLSLLLLIATVMPFVSFIRELFGTEEKVGWTTIYVYNALGLGSCLVLQFTGVADLEEMVFVAYIGFGLMVAYAVYSAAYVNRKRVMSERMKVHAIATILLLLVIGADLFQPGGPPNLGVVSNLGLAIYLVALGGMSASQAMRQVEHTKRSRYFEELAYTDISTGLGSRNAYLADIENGNIAPGHLVITFDLNELKRTNDIFGHLTGDRYIKDAARIIENLFGDYGKCYRIGGDEFCLITAKLHQDNVERMLFALHREQERYNKTSADVVMGIACGYALYIPNVDASLEDTRKRADEMMYRHKAKMKNDGFALKV